MNQQCSNCIYYKEIVKRKPGASSFGRCLAAQYFVHHVYGDHAICVFNKYTPNEE